VCPKCYSPFLSHDLSLEQEKHLARVFRKVFVRDLLWLISLVLLMIGGSIIGSSIWWGGQLHKAVLNRVEEEFQQPRIKATVETAIETKAQSMLREEIEPKVSEFQREIGGEIGNFSSFLQTLEGKFKEDYQTLSKEVSILEQRNRLTLLGDKAITDGSKQAFNEINDFIKNGTDLNLVTAAKAESARVVSFWALMTRIKGVSISTTRPDGIEKKDESISTPQLIIAMLHHDDWQVRAAAANLLRQRNHKGVPEALLESARKDENLEVVKHAIAAFRSVTGCECHSPLDVEPLESWWRSHSKEVNDKLTEPEP
jgi:hypothetical protein